MVIRLFLLAFALLTANSLVYAGLGSEQQGELKAKLQKLITLSSEDPQALFAGVVQPQKYEARRQQLIEQAKEIRELAQNNEELKRLANQAHFAIQKAYNAVAPKLQQLSDEDTKKFKDFISLARQEPAAIFSDPAMRDALKTRLLNKIAMLKGEAQEWLPDSKKLIADVELWIKNAYDKTAGIIKKGLSKATKEKLNAIKSSSVEEIFPDEALLVAPQEKLDALDQRVNKLRDILNGFTKNASPDDVNLIQVASKVIDELYNKRKQQIEARAIQPSGEQNIVPAVAAVLEISTGGQAPPMEAGPEAPPLEGGSNKAPSVLGAAEAKPSQKLPRMATDDSRDKLLEDIRRGKQLKPVVQRPQRANPAQKQGQLSLTDELRRRLASRRAGGIAPEGEEGEI